MKELVTKFDLESAFKALDELDIPVAEKGIRANKPALTEIFSRKTKFDALLEDYYDISTGEGLDGAKDAREAEIAQAKLERIEKIVDLDADSAEDLLTSYVGKYIMQCPQCMTLFYKNKEDIVESEDDSSNVNVGEVCQHCGNESGYTLVGKVDEAKADEAENFDLEAGTEEPVDEEPAEEPAEDNEEAAADDDLEIDLDAINLDDITDDEEPKEESFINHGGEALVEELADDPDLDAKLAANDAYVEYLRATIEQEKKSLENESNEQIKAVKQRNIEALDADLQKALPDAVKDGTAISNEPAEDLDAEDADSDITDTDGPTEAEEVSESLTESLHEDIDLSISDAEFEELLNSPEFKQPISDNEVEEILASDSEEVEECANATSKSHEDLTEGNILDLGKAAVKGVFNAGKGLAKFASVAIDKIGDFVKSREEKANWLLAYTRVDYKTAEFNDKGEAVAPENTDRKFTKFLVVGFKEKNSHKQIITRPQKYTTKGLIPGDDGVKEFENYKDADNFAKGWSIGEGNGPAFIYLTKNRSDNETAFLCEYFKGKLEFDQVGEYFNLVKKYWESAWRTSGAAVSKTAKGKTAGTVEPAKFAFESLTGDNTNQVLEQLDDIQEQALEENITKSLVESYKNVSGFKLSECAYIDNKLIVNGVINFASGNTRNTTYAFNSLATTANGKLGLLGLNEKLGLDKQFILTGRIDNKTLITESFSCNK